MEIPRPAVPRINPLLGTVAPATVSPPPPAAGPHRRFCFERNERLVRPLPNPKGHIHAPLGTKARSFVAGAAGFLHSALRDEGKNRPVRSVVLMLPTPAEADFLPVSRNANKHQTLRSKTPRLSSGATILPARVMDGTGGRGREGDHVDGRRSLLRLKLQHRAWRPQTRQSEKSFPPRGLTAAGHIMVVEHGRASHLIVLIAG
jgi:hypothetical protein